MLKINAYAKVNITLSVTGRSGDLHTIDTIMTSVSLFDQLTITPNDTAMVNVDFGGVDVDRNNTVIKAVCVLKKYADFGGVDILVDKAIPIGAGLGGASADAAATLVGLNRLFSLGLSVERLQQIALEVGSDVPFMIRGGCARVGGVGDVITQLSPIEARLLLVRDDNAISTSMCYQVYDMLSEASRRTQQDVEAVFDCFLNGGELLSPLKCNALLAPAMIVSPSIKNTLTRMTGLKTQYITMSGSGNTCFAKISAHHGVSFAMLDGLWQKVVTTLPYGIKIL